AHSEAVSFRALEAEPRKRFVGERSRFRELRVLIVRTAHTHADDHIVLQNVQRSAETIAAPKCLLSDTIDFFARYFSFPLLARLTAVSVLLPEFILGSRGFFEGIERLSPKSSWIGFGRLRIFFDHRKTNRLI